MQRVRPQAFSRLRCKDRSSEAHEGADVTDEDLGQLWCASFIEHQGIQQRCEGTSEAPCSQEQSVVQSDLEDCVLRDLLELDLIGAGVVWPRGLDARIARTILDARAEATALSAEAATAAAEGSSNSSSSSSSSSSYSTSGESSEPQPKRQRTRRCEGAQA